MPPTPPPPPLPRSLRPAAYIFPPAGLFLLWRNSAISLPRKIFFTLGLALYSIIYAAGVVALLMQFAGLQLEWQGGFPPVLTFHKTVPDFAAVEADRARKMSSKNVKRSFATSPDAPWPGFRGRHRNGLSTETISTHWPTTGLPMVWKQPGGAGYASFAIAEGMAFTIEQRRQEEVIVAYDITTGHEVWTQKYPARFDEPLGGEGPRATPAYDHGKLYSLGALGDFVCLEAARGQILWHQNILQKYQGESLTYGTSASPLVVGDTVIVCPGGTDDSAIVACHKISGELVWKALPDRVAYASPMLMELVGQEQLLVLLENRVVGLEPGTGRLLWSFPWTVKLGNRPIAQPVWLGGNRFFLSAGYGTGCACVEIRKTDSRFSAGEVWRNKNLKNKFSSSVFHEGHIYGLDEDMLVCLDAQTGERQWKEGRYGYGQLLLASGHLVILSGSGELALVQATAEKYEERFRFQALRGKTWNHPALADGKIFVRNLVEMACFDLAPK